MTYHLDIFINIAFGKMCIVMFKYEEMFHSDEFKKRSKTSRDAGKRTKDERVEG